MESKLFGYIMRLLRRAHYEYDPSVKAWVAWIEGFPGVYAQARSVEQTRADLISSLEDRLLLDLREGKRIPGFMMFARPHAKTD